MVNNVKIALHRNLQFVVKVGASLLLLGFAFRFLNSPSTEFSYVPAEIPSPENNAHIGPLSPIPSLDPQEKTDDIVKPEDINQDQVKREDINQVQEKKGDTNQGQEKKEDTNQGQEKTEGTNQGQQKTEDTYQGQQKTVDTNQDTKEKCNLFLGDWVYTESYPLYTYETCSFIDDPQNCIKNGRLDTGYLHWRWNPRGCNLPQFNPRMFLELMSNKTMALIGDSISRNHVQSLLCMLSTVTNPTLVYHDETYKSRRWIFPSYNFTISIIWSPLLGKAAIFEDQHGVSSSEIELHLDKLDPTWTHQFRNLDYMIFSTGVWFLKSTIYYENNTIQGCNYCPKRNITDLGYASAYHKILRNIFDYIVSSNHKGMVFYRTTSPNHFEYGAWYEGGSCNKTQPVKEGEFAMEEKDRLLHDIELEEFDKAKGKANENGINLRLFDVTYLSLLRPDGHAGSDRYFQEIGKKNYGKPISDCLHWCVPGVIDYWNDLLMEIVVNG